MVTTAQLTRVALSTGVTLEVEILGPRDAPPVILLHGFPESCRTWRHQLLALALRHRVIAPNQRGYGNSSRPNDVADYTPELLMADVIALADALEYDRFALVGHDWGGALGWGVAIRHPRRVERLALINAPHPQLLQRQIIANPEQRRASQILRTLREMAVDADPTEAALDQALAALVAAHPQATFPPEKRERYLEAWRQPGALRAMLHWYRASGLVVPGPFEAAPLPGWAAGPFPLVSQPTLLIWGMLDSGLTPSLLDGIEALVPRLRILRIPDAGHFPQWEAPATVTRALVRWLSGDTAAAAS